MNSHSFRAATDFLESWLAFRVAQADVPGVSVAVRVGDRIFSSAYGIADITSRSPLTTEHRFAMGSQSKMFTATAIMQLAEEGKLGIDDAAAKYLPWLTTHADTRAHTMTIRQLLSHSTGLAREGRKADYWQLLESFPTARQVRQRILEAHFLEYSAVKYSNLGYALLGLIIEKVSGKTYKQYISENIIARLQLAQTSVDRTRVKGSFAIGHSPRQFQRRNPLDFQASSRAFAPVTGIWSTPADMCQFAAAQCTKDSPPLRAESRVLMRQVQQKVTEGYSKGATFGLGYEIIEKADQQLIGHSGHVGGQNTATFFDPHTGWVVSVAVNCKDVSARQIVNGIFEALHFFHTHCSQPVPQQLVPFACRVMNIYASVQIIPTASVIVAIDPNDWRPFAWADQLVYKNPTTLQIITSGNIFNEGESVRFSFQGDTIEAVDFTGPTFTPL